MIILYLSDHPGGDAAGRTCRERTPPEHSADYARYARKASCDANGNFSFSGLPNGVWYVITVATPANGTKMAVMRRVTTNGGTRPSDAVLGGRRLRGRLAGRWAFAEILLTPRMARWPSSRSIGRNIATPRATGCSMRSTRRSIWRAPTRTCGWWW